MTLKKLLSTGDLKETSAVDSNGVRLPYVLGRLLKTTNMGWFCAAGTNTQAHLRMGSINIGSLQGVCYRCRLN
jgi:hypothetical protein